MVFPLLLGLCLLVSSIILFVKSGSSPQSSSAALFPREEYRSVICIAGIFFLFTLIFEYLGSLISIFVLMLLLMKVIGRKTVGEAFLYSSIITLSTYLVFEILLGVRLPKSIVSF